MDVEDRGKESLYFKLNNTIIHKLMNIQITHYVSKKEKIVYIFTWIRSFNLKIVKLVL